MNTYDENTGNKDAAGINVGKTFSTETSISAGNLQRISA